MKRHKWMEDDINFLKENYHRMSIKGLAKEMELSFVQVQSALKRFKIKLTKEERLEHNKKRIQSRCHNWTEEELEWLKRNYGNLTANECAEWLKITKYQVKNKVNKIGLKGNPENSKLHHFGNGNRGYVAPKGTHISPATEFKKGHLPQNTKYNGCISYRMDKRAGAIYKYIRLEMGRWVPVHRYLWEKKHGAIPPKTVITFKDGNQMNCRLSNLELIPMSENIKRNRNYESDNYLAARLTHNDKNLRNEIKKHPEIIELKKLQNELRRMIDEYLKPIGKDEGKNIPLECPSAPDN